MPFFYLKKLIVMPNIQTESLEKLLAKDNILKQIVEQFGEPIIQVREQGFASLCHIILEQQVSIASAKACYQKIENHLGVLTPFTVLNCTDEALKTCGVSRQKCIYLKDLATRILQNKFDFAALSTQSETQIRETLSQVKGIGNWTIDVYLMFCMQHQDLIPLGDIAIKNTIKSLYNLHDFQSQQLLSDQWKPHRTLASFILWHHYLSKRKK